MKRAEYPWEMIDRLRAEVAELEQRLETQGDEFLRSTNRRDERIRHLESDLEEQRFVAQEAHTEVRGLLEMVGDLERESKRSDD